MDERIIVERRNELYKVRMNKKNADWMNERLTEDWKGMPWAKTGRTM